MAALALCTLPGPGAVIPRSLVLRQTVLPAAPPGAGIVLLLMPVRPGPVWVTHALRVLAGRGNGYGRLSPAGNPRYLAGPTIPAFSAS
jgi:hypothetical protein